MTWLHHAWVLVAGESIGDRRALRIHTHWMVSWRSDKMSWSLASKTSSLLMTCHHVLPFKRHLLSITSRAYGLDHSHHICLTIWTNMMILKNAYTRQHLLAACKAMLHAGWCSKATTILLLQFHTFVKMLSILTQ